MPLTGHLKELRNRIFVVVLVLVVGICACLAFSSNILEIFKNVGADYNYKFVSIAPQETLLVLFNISLIGGLIVTVPVIAYEVYAFMSPGLKAKEKTLFLFAMLAGFIFFIFGVLFAYFISMRFMLRFLINISVSSGIASEISIQQYVSFLLTVFVIFGTVFELPVVSVLLSSLGVIKPEWLIKGRKVMIVVIFFIAAVITPPDVVSQFMIAVPMLILYELSIFLCKLVTKLKKKKQDEEEEE